MDADRVYEIDRLLECDTGNVAESKRALLALNADSLNAADECARLLQRIGVLFGEICKYDEYNQQINEWLKTRPGDPAFNANLLERATLIGRLEGRDEIAEAKDALVKGTAVIARSYLILRLGRDFLFGLSDLLRLRLTSLFGYLRVQTETVGILTLARSDPEMAANWLNWEDGRKFYNKYHKRIIAKVKELALNQYYENGSNIALHSRVLGVAPGIVIGKKNAAPGHVRLTYQEIDDAVTLFGWFCVYLKAHREIIGTLPQALPEIDFSKVDIQPYGRLLQDLWGTLGNVYTGKRS